MPDPVLPRPAASLLVWRAFGEGAVVLMGLRGAGHRFMPNRLVFPGGAVDPGDRDAAAASEPLPHVRRLLAGQADAGLGRALLHAAARELDEETGLSLGRPPALAGLDYLCRAITPAASPVRFDAHFFTVGADAASGTLAGSGELEDLRWIPLAEARVLDLAFVTRHVLGQFEAWLALAPAGRAARGAVPVLRERVWSDG
ncbi:MAG: NUDIX hydrolase [Acidisphaera sp.]|nr:NUDIX hydrolase [Acidisphaera sp.]MBV9812883.1 NUDIX hydrolase [Acetobacteraceae bacterium]